MFDLDILWTQAINARAGHAGLFDWAMINVSRLAVPLLVLVVALQWWRSGPFRQIDRHTIVAAGLTCASALVVNQIILLFIQRSRPYVHGITHLLTSPSTDPSFPSDHAAATFAIAAAFLLHGANRRGILFMLLAAIVSYSRVYIGTHYVSDVVGGALVAVVTAIAVILAFRPGTRLDQFLVNIL